MNAPVSAPLFANAPKGRNATISQRLARFATQFTYDTVPEAVRERAKDLILDAIGVALASTQYDFSHRILSGIRGMADGGDCSVIGMPDRLPLRDAALMNGVLIHGLDYDDSHLRAVLHPTVTAFICALAGSEKVDRSGRDLLAAYVLGVESVIRIAAAAKGAFHYFGFHPTGLLGHFSCAITAGWLYGLNATQLAMAQGLAGSTAAATQEFLEEGAWNKRLHPGWAAVAGITAANLARGGTIGPTKPYEGRLGVYNTHLHDRAKDVDLASITDGLGSVWELPNIAVKPFPVCHFIHACGDAALMLRDKHQLDPARIEKITALVARETLHIIAEPVANKKRPANDYDAKFSVHYFVAVCLMRGRFGLAELEAETRNDPAILALAQKVEAMADPDSQYPSYLSGGVLIRTSDGREFKHHEEINRGAGDRALTSQDIEAKFFENARLAVSDRRAREIRDAVRNLEQLGAREFAAVVAAR